MARPKGLPKTGGRKKGVPNKSTVAVKEAMQDAFEQLGGVPSLVAWGRENQTEFYRLWTKLLPTEVKADLSSSDGTMAPLVIELTHEHPTDSSAD